MEHTFAGIKIGGLEIPFFGVFFTLVGIYLVSILIYYWRKPSKYKSKMTLIRKSYYVGYLCLMGAGIVGGWIDYKDWKLLTELSALSIFIDLAVFLTPNIMKIWSAQLKYEPDEVMDIIQQNEKTLKNTENKVSKMFEVVKYSSIHFESRNPCVHWRKYKDELREYLNFYAETFQFRIAIFQFEMTSDEQKIKNSLSHAFSNVEKCYNCTIGENRDSIIEALFNGNGKCLVEGNIYVVPYFGTMFNCLIGIKAETDIPVHTIDVSHIVSLAYMFDWWMTE